MEKRGGTGVLEEMVMSARERDLSLVRKEGSQE